MSRSPASVRVAVLSPPFAVLRYSLPEYLPAAAFQPGQRVVVPLGKSLRVGIFLGPALTDEGGASREGESAPDPRRDPAGAAPDGEREADGEASIPLRPILWPLEREALLPPSHRDLAAQLALRHTETHARVLANMLPAGLRNVQARLRFFGGGAPLELRPRDLAALPAEELERLGRLWTAGQAEVRRSSGGALDRELCRLALDPPWPVRPAAKAQQLLLEYLHERGEVSRRKLLAALGKGAAPALALLAGRGLVRIRPADGETAEEDSLPAIIAPAAEAVCLTPGQRAVVDPLLLALRAGKAETRLLFGITGSGKTAVYLELARAALDMGKSALLLAPEVALALKLWGDARGALPGTRATLFHGYLSPVAKEAIFRDLAAPGGEPRLLVGTRSALLLPLDRLGLIVLDEEHDASFKQDEGLPYQAKEVAWYRAEKEGALLLLGSATPDVKSFYAASQGRIPLHVLTERVGGGRLPEVRVAALGGRNASPLAPESLESLRSVLERGEQAIILLNRRGYAPVMYCPRCSSTAKCPQCDIGLAYHKGRERLLCHYCGYAVPFPSPCAGCKGTHFLPMGEGTEKLEEDLGAMLPPGTGILRLDRDSARRPGRMEEILSAFARKEASVLLGTQMLSKGHHFPDVTLAIVADADIGLNLPDYRAAERTFQLLLQSAGRAGRGEKPGSVIIQTRDPAHYCWEYVRRADYRGFYERELALRERRAYPPFARLALIRLSYAADDADGQAQVAALGAFLRPRAARSGLTLLGPAPAPLPFLKGRHRWHCLIKGQDWRAMRALYAAALDGPGKGRLRARLDLDPVNML
jgi:primosomal protein N' (replication factor Y)